MAISPKDLKPSLQKQIAQFNVEVASMERRIDNALKEKVPKPGQIVEVELFRSASDQVIAKLMEIYSAAGWKVTYPEQSRSDPRKLAFEYCE